MIIAKKKRSQKKNKFIAYFYKSVEVYDYKGEK
jgi:hypothetical protein